MAKVFNTFVKKVRRVVQIVGGDDVLTNRIRIDFRDRLARLLESRSVGLRVLEKARFRTTDALVVIAKAFDPVRFLESARVFATATVFEKLARLSESNFVGIRVFNSISARTSQFIGLRVSEFSRFSESVFIFARATVQNNTRHRVSQSTALRTFEVGASVRTDQSFTVNAIGFAESVQSQSNFDTPNNALGNTTNTSALATIASSGLAGTTSNTEAFSIVLEMPNVDLSALISTITNATVNIEHSSDIGGVSVGGATNYQGFYGFNGASDQQVFQANAAVGQAVAKAIASLNITALVANDFARINSLRIRVAGSNTSGAGLGAVANTRVFRAWFTFTGQGSNAN